ncbi:putative calcium-binding protein CML18 [Camellia lanceoleosa]|uniref:Calcium-binding protein CML18 n=1 Tax=Camellia lanceoleosa TaxID=1840588 RepID=A0ACC0IRY4_9ERIC|nr:putative calcium-binding protein CML18 [Camellia lanceoleosa]
MAKGSSNDLCLRVVLSALGSNTSLKEVQEVMSEIDNNDDGFIDLHKFVDFHRGGSNDDDESSSKKLRYAFDLCDQDGNGLISAKKLHAVLKSLEEKCS